MLKPISKLAFLTFFWQRYKSHIKSLLVFLVVLFLIFFAHAEYLSYTKAAGVSDYIGLSFLIKWLAIVIAAVVYILFPSRGKKSIIVAKPKVVTSPTKTDKSDPFDHIREKTVLKSRGDFVIEGKKHPRQLDKSSEI